MYDCKVEIAKREYICKSLYVLLQLLQLLQFVLGYMWLQNRFIYIYNIYIIYINKNFFMIFIASFLTVATVATVAQSVSFPEYG